MLVPTDPSASWHVFSMRHGLAKAMFREGLTVG
jgi:hypothetical protein